MIQNPPPIQMRLDQALAIARAFGSQPDRDRAEQIERAEWDREHEAERYDEQYEGRH